MTARKRLPGDGAKPMEGKDLEAWTRIQAGGETMATSFRAGDAAGFVEGMKALRETTLDPKVILNSLHMPPDGGEYTEGLIQILRRIPDGWGRWISCGPGWYPMLVELDQSLAAIQPDYVVHQVKEKYGQLRYYFASIGSRSQEKRMTALVDAAEERSVTICEVCGNPGRICVCNRWYRTVCPACAEILGYSSIGTSEGPVDEGRPPSSQDRGEEDGDAG